MKFTEAIKLMPSYIGSKGRSEEEIKQAEKVLDIYFAKDYRKYLEEIGLACFDGHEFTGLTDTTRLNVMEVTKEYREQLGDEVSSWYVIEEVGMDGIIIWQTPDGIIYGTTPSSKTVKIADSLFEYIFKRTNS
jgi:hypothetical protein